MSETTPPPDHDSDAQGERELLHRLAFAALTEQRRARRWGIFFKSLWFVVLIALLMAYWPGRDEGEGISSGRHTALVDLKGVIADGSGSGSADTVITGLRNAFNDKDTAGVILRINSPGGSPVQAGYIYDEIRRLRKEHPKIPIYAVVSDICASGGYYVAAATDKIYANRASIVGSIGVLMNGFGFVGTLQKLGIQRRLITAGAHKGFLDPFSPENPQEVAYLKKMLEDIHQQFITAVKEGRGARLKKNDPDLFSGLVWTGDKAVSLGLVDGLGSARYVARDVIGAPTIVDYTQRPRYFERLAATLGSSMVNSFGSQLRMERLQ